MTSPLARRLDRLATAVVIAGTVTILCVPVVAIPAAIVAGVLGEFSRDGWLGGLFAVLALAIAAAFLLFGASIVVSDVAARLHRRARTRWRRQIAARSTA